MAKNRNYQRLVIFERAKSPSYLLPLRHPLHTLPDLSVFGDLNQPNKVHFALIRIPSERTAVQLPDRNAFSRSIFSRWAISE